MAEKKTTEKKENFFSRAGKWFVNLPMRIAGSFNKMWRELKKVTWPTREKLTNYAVIVLLFMLFMTVVIGLLDMGASQLVNLIMTNFSA